MTLGAGRSGLGARGWMLGLGAPGGALGLVLGRCSAARRGDGTGLALQAWMNGAVRIQSRGFPVAVIALALAFSAAVSAQQPEGTSGHADSAPAPEEPVRDLTSPGAIDKIRAWVAKQQERYENVSKYLDRVGVRPDIGTLGQGSGVSAGATLRRDAIAGSPLDIETSAGFSYRGYERYEFRLGRLQDRERRTTLGPADDPVASHFDAYTARARGLSTYVDLRYRHSPRHKFFGEGPDAREEDESSFLLRGASYDLVTEYQPAAWLGFAARGGFLDLAAGHGGDHDRPSTDEYFDDRAAPGLSRQPAFVHLGAAIAVDARDSAAASRSGGMLGLLLWRFAGVNTSIGDFSRVALDGRYYVPTSAVSVLALRVVASGDFADHGARVPFYLQQTLGGDDLLRGFQRARFRDTSLFDLAAEYRWDVHRAIELVAFGDVGQVAPRFAALAARQLEGSWGAGIRFTNDGAVRARLDVAFGREGTRVIVSTGPAF